MLVLCLLHVTNIGYSSSMCLMTQPCLETLLLFSYRSGTESSVVSLNSTTLAPWGHCTLNKYFHVPCLSFSFVFSSWDEINNVLKHESTKLLYRH